MGSCGRDLLGAGIIINTHHLWDALYDLPFIIHEELYFYFCLMGRNFSITWYVLITLMLPWLCSIRLVDIVVGGIECTFWRSSLLLLQWRSSSVRWDTTKAEFVNKVHLIGMTFSGVNRIIYDIQFVENFCINFAKWMNEARVGSYLNYFGNCFYIFYL